MKYYIFLFFFVLFSSFLIAQEELIPNKQFMLGCTNVGSSEQVKHYIEAVGAVWEKNSNNFIISSNQSVYNNSLVTTGNANFSEPDWPGFNFIWLDTQFSMPRWGLGLYKVTNYEQPDNYFYIDARDKSYGTISGGYSTPDFYVFFNNGDSVYQYNRFFPQPTIPNGGLISVWEIFGKSPNTSGLQNYWGNVLVAVNNNNHPRLIWGPYPSESLTINNYKVYRKYGASSWQLLTTVSSTTYEYTDGTVTLSGQQAGTDVQYKVTAIYNTNYETSASNIVTVNVQGGEIEKKVSSEEFSLNEFKLDQNFPNPFNPSTVISFSISENSFVSLKIYDVLGNEITELINEIKAPGNYSVSFDASKLASGIYFYGVQANSYSLTKKMLLAK